MKKDNAPEKRVELHLHTKMSADGRPHGGQLKTSGRTRTWSSGRMPGAIPPSPSPTTVWPSPSPMPGALGQGQAEGPAGRRGLLYQRRGRPRRRPGPPGPGPLTGAIVCFDMETTGLRPDGEDVITEIGAVVLENGAGEGAVPHLCRPPAEAGPRTSSNSPASPTTCWWGPPARRRPCGPFWPLWTDRPAGRPQRGVRHGLCPRPGAEKYGIPFDNHLPSTP